jgi:hypothetical protein
LAFVVRAAPAALIRDADAGEVRPGDLTRLRALLADWPDADPEQMAPVHGLGGRSGG